MIRHCVFIRFRADITKQQRREIFTDIAALKHVLTGIIAVHIGANISPETGMDKGYNDGFIVDFTDDRARDAYLIAPAHKAAGAKLVAAAEGGADGIFVYDLAIEN